ncbi:hypothetical protein L596_012448 [Steinernema carpocapsae]|uniref:DUF4139 domain-containing protein n=1 Tax=Steinernema carpocapsae TaxID=34508 RepID=A0A4U5NXG0_STECR|nr:hypothetical protein L596_012448 [Steinernema carpocapsae]
MSTFKASDLPLESVTVYNDRAQVTRELKTALNVGFHEITITHLPATIDCKSVQFEGLGPARIHDVNFGFKNVEADDGSKKEIEELKEALKELAEKQEDIEDEAMPFQVQLDSLNERMTKVGKGEAVEDIVSFYEYYEKRAATLQSTIRNLWREKTAIQAEIRKRTAKLKFFNPSKAVSKNVVVVVEVLRNDKFCFMLSYEVSRAQWRPRYDLRLVSAVNVGQKTVLKVDYFAEIQQKTGEDWKNAKVFLSTAQPGFRGEVPELKTLNASLVQQIISPVGGGLFGAPAAKPARGSVGFGGAPATSGLFGSTSAPSQTEFAPPPPPPEPVEKAEMSVNQQILAAEFEVAHKKTIPSDDSYHKMLITTLEFDPSLLYECVPKLSVSAYLTATVTNDSAFPLLKGEASVYLNNCFVSKTVLDLVSPGDKFTCSLGIDSAVKITYVPGSRVKGEGGVFHKHNMLTNTQKIAICNSKPAEEITIIVREQYPKSNNDKIKVTLLEPTIQNTEPQENNDEVIPGITIDADHNLKWVLTLLEGEKKEMSVKWLVEYPGNEQLTLQETAKQFNFKEVHKRNAFL